MKKLIITSFLLLTACYNPQLNIATMPKAPTEGPPEYIQGWKAGCETGLATYGNSYYRTRYRTNINPYRMENIYYNKGWELGQRHCSYYSSTYLSNKEMSRVSDDGISQSDLRGGDTWISLKSDGFFNYEGFDVFKW